jgi:hypothetical protein
MVEYMKSIPCEEIAVLLSSGVDSHLLLFAILDAGKTPICYSATLDDRESKDFTCARNTADLLGLKFVPVILPTDVKHIYNFVKEEIYGPINPGIIVTKAHAECLWPVARIFDKIKEKAVVIGFGGDIWFSTLRSQKKEWLAGTYKEYVETQRLLYTGKTVKCPRRMVHDKYLALYKKGLKLYEPYYTKQMFKIMDGMDPIKEGWNPIQKAPFRLAFWEYFELCKDNVYMHVNLQKGDSGISEHFLKLLATDLNTGNYKSTLGIYNDQLRKWREENE